ncbi:MAG: polyprenyl synthetase family protein [Phycisphaerales bacterium]
MRGVLDLPDHLLPVQERISSALARVEEAFDRQLASDLAPVAELCAHVERYRGKMLRPVLAILCGEAASPEPDENPVADELIRLAAVCEMVHMATLVHDDVLDEAEVRRRGATINHLRGNEAAVILGDYLIAGAYALCASIGRTELDQRIARVSMDVCAGELLQLHHGDDWALDEATYFEIVGRKTGALIGVACELGALVGGADPRLASALFDAGVDLGVAFQIRDDLLDLTGLEAAVGKSVGKDLEKGKPTLPVIHHLASLEGSRRDEMLELLCRGAHPENDEARARVLEGVRATGSIEYAERIGAERVERARQTIGRLAPSSARELLDHLALAVLDRTY